MRFLIVFFVLLSFSEIYAQADKLFSDNIADCDGATTIINPGSYSLQFRGNTGDIKDIEAYPSLKTLQETNTIWCYFIAPYDGRLSLDAKISSGILQLIAFQNEDLDLCRGLYSGTTEIKRLIQDATAPKVGLSVVINENYLYPMDLLAGQKVMFLFNTKEKGKPVLDLTLKFDSKQTTDRGIENFPRKVIDNRTNAEDPALNIMIRDAETGVPVIANLNVIGNKGYAALFLCSDIFVNISKTEKLTLECDAPGYFFSDRTELVVKETAHEIVLWLQPLTQGKSLRIEDIEFQPGNSELMLSSNAKLRRLKDFLALNSAVKIEIQGHVNSTGENTFAAQKLSEARAKRIYNYLIENGIDKSRLSHKGYGNTAPIFERPKFAYEEQANRRVEIKVM